MQAAVTEVLTRYVCIWGPLGGGEKVTRRVVLSSLDSLHMCGKFRA
jgi:hypothetical protein